MPYARLEDKKRAARKWYLAGRKEFIFRAKENYWKNRERIREQRKKHYLEKNPEEMREQRARYYRRTREQALKRQSEYRKKNSGAIREWFKQNRKILCQKQTLRRRTDELFRLKENLRSRVRIALKGICKSARTMELIGCTIENLREYLEAQFVPGMTWENYGPVWHVDHIKPCILFRLSDPTQQRKCFHFSNLQPLFARDNLKKNRSYA